MKRHDQHSAGIVLFRPGQERTYLLLRSALTRRPVWEFPKGGIETGESLREAAERELREETGLGEDGYEVYEGFTEDEQYVFTRGSGERRRLIRKRVSYFIARWIKGEVEISREATAYRWVPREEAERLLQFPEKRRILASADAWLEENEAKA